MLRDIRTDTLISLSIYIYIYIYIYILLHTYELI